MEGLVYRPPVMATRRAADLAKWRRAAVRRIESSRASTLAFLAQLPEPAIRESRTQDRWSVKDILAHLLACDEETVRRFRLIARGHGDRIHWFESMADADRFNARTVTRLRQLGLPTLLGRMARVRAEMVAALEAVPVEALRDPSHAYTVVEWLPEPGWSHERGHVGEIKSWWRARRRGA
jgi:hypothetical protein